MKFGAYYRFLLYSLIFLCLSLALGLSQKDEHSDHDMDERQFLVGLEEKSTDDDFKACKNWIELHGGTITLSMNEDYGRLMVVKMNNHICKMLINYLFFLLV